MVHKINKLIKGLDRAQFNNLKTWCSYKGIKIGEGVSQIFAAFFKNKKIKLYKHEKKDI